MTATVRPYDLERDRDAVPALILTIQTGEFGIPITLADQPDLLDVPGTYFQGKGCFLVAEAPGVQGPSGDLAGTVALIDCGEGLAALRKMFVAKDHRGKAKGVSRALLDAAIAHARENGFSEILLGTVAVLEAARAFYAREGFTPVEPDHLPPHFPRMAIDTHFFRLVL
ncbi:GNAT family N-acetyltransferase [Rhodospirillum sp. A1_3_36]|uniref:GNAT family N-acetyltransferase n=1 Tax=Rhodospirillum sp. A1_3_36 TaxID=3391666 RepID=UPI0039A6CD37